MIATKHPTNHSVSVNITRFNRKKAIPTETSHPNYLHNLTSPIYYKNSNSKSRRLLLSIRF